MKRIGKIKVLEMDMPPSGITAFQRWRQGWNFGNMNNMNLVPVLSSLDLTNHSHFLLFTAFLFLFHKDASFHLE